MHLIKGTIIDFKKPAERVKYLGLLIDEKLKWTDHIEHVYNKIIKYIGIFYKIRNKLPFDIY